MLQPKTTKYRKTHKGRNRGYSYCKKLVFGNFGMIAITRGKISAKQLESARKVITRVMKRQGNIWIRIFPDKPITLKPLEVRMGKGKGNVEYWVSVIKPGTMIFELSNVNLEIAKQAIKLANDKLPIKTIFIKNFV